VTEAIDRGVALPVITASLFARFSSRTPNAYSARIIAALRNQFGGHKFFTEAAAAEQKKTGDEAKGIITSSAEAQEHHG
jgi:6-phosphogluconate dehydrogenase